MTKETWKDIPDYEGLYEISNHGEVRRKNGDILRQWKTHCGYKMVQLWKNGKGKHKSIHRLVASAFLENPENLPQVNHIDENKENNNAFNLEWCTAQQNINHGTRNARVSTKQTNNPKTSKPIRQYTREGVFVAEYPSINEAARCVGIKTGSIHFSANSGGKLGGGYVWKYA